MRLAGFTFNKINAEKFDEKAQELKVETNIDISNVKEIKSALSKTKTSFLSIDFSYFIEYNPKIAKLSFEGNLVLAMDQKIAKEVVKEVKEKKMSDEFKVSAFNFILRKVNLKAAQLEEDLGLPAHFQMPSLKLPEKSN